MSDQASLRQVEETSMMKQSLTTLFDQQNAAGILDQTRQNAQAFYFTLSLIQTLISSANLQNTERGFIIRLLFVLAQEFGIPVALALENEEFISFFETCLKSDQVPETASLMSLLTNLFYSDSEKDFIPSAVDLYRKFVNQGQASFNKIPRSEFFELYKNVHQILKIQKTSLDNEDTKTLLLFTIRTLIDKSNFENPNFNSLEKHLLKNYQQELSQVLSLLENEKEEARRLKKLKELEAISLNSLPKEEQLAHRVNFFQGESIPFSESEQNEYKDYSFPFNESLEKTLTKTVCSFLNQKGGRIFIGITDNKVVKGIQLSQYQKHELVMTINRLLSNFEPSIIGQDLYRIDFLPIQDKKTNQVLPNLYVVKILVLQGDPNDLYSITRDVLQCYVRYEDQSKLLSALQTKEAIIERSIQANTKTPNRNSNENPANISANKSLWIPQDQSEYRNNFSLKDDSSIDVNNFQYLPMTSILENPHFETRSRNDSVTSASAYEMVTFDMNISDGSKYDLDQTMIAGRDSLKGKTSTYEETTIDSTYGQVLSDTHGRSFVPFLEETSLKDRSYDSKILEDFNPSLIYPNYFIQKSSSRNSFPAKNPKERSSLKTKEVSSEEFPKVKKEGSYSFSSAGPRSSTEAKKKAARNEPKQYYSHILETVNSLQINGTNAMKVNEIFVDGLPTTWTQEAFEKFVEDLNCKSVLSSRMFKKDTGHCNGKAFLNFTDKEEAKKFVEKYDGTTTFGKPLKVKFK